jgi:hypothetical protein
MKRILLVLASLAPQLSQAAPPEPPALMRVATGVIRNTTVSPATHSFTRPHIPSLRTTPDGRIALIVEGGGPEGGSPRFTLMAPEKLTAPVLASPAGSYTVSQSGFKWLDGYASAGASSSQFTLPNTSDGVRRNVSHACLWETSPPTTVSGEDVYTLKIFACTNWAATVAPLRRTQFFVTPIKIYVSNPKTPSAAIRSIQRDTTAPNSGATVGGPEYSFVASGFEPVIAGDGRLLIIRIGSGLVPWTDPVTGTAHSGQGADIVYSYYPTGAAADPSQWTQLIPISHAPYDSRINTKFGFAMAPFRDTEGTLIPDGEDIGGSYPWIDREADNLFFETIRETLHYADSAGVWNQSRYPISAVPEQPITYKPEDTGTHQGVAYCGLWSHGKIVLLDNMVNDTDYAVGASDNTDPLLSGPEQRFVELYQQDPARALNGLLRMGYGRATTQMPLGENDNANIIDSIESVFNYRKYAVPISHRDVAWHVSVGKQTDELSFDDYMDPDALIVANMTGSLTFNNNGSATNFFTHHSGWNSSAKTFSNPVKLANAATSPSSRWALPTHGLIRGNGRLEPAAVGGVHGKGLWMDGTTGLEFVIPTQPQSISGKEWYVSLFVDCRHTDDGVERRLLTYPDGSTISLIGRRQIVYAKSGIVANRISLPPVLSTTPVTQWHDLLPDTSWAHLAFQVRKSGTAVDFHLNGIIYNRWEDGYTSLFQPSAGTLTLGRPNLSTLSSFLGWLDDFKLLAHSVDLETACNHANGTLIGLPAAYTGDWKTKFADRYPSWAHDFITTALKANGETSYPKYACFYNPLRDHGAHRHNIPSGTVTLRQSIHFPEGPLFHNRPRPHSQQNEFCLSCHKATSGGAGKAGLDLDAIALDGTFNADQDPRRQPSQPQRRIYGYIPAGLVDSTSLPSSAIALPSTGHLIDQWLLGSFSGATAVQSYTVVDATSGRDLAVLVSGGVVDPAKLGSKNLTLRANLNSAQGYVNMQYDNAAVNQRPTPPYAVFGTSTSPLAGQILTPGAHTLKATPQYGSMNTLSFTVAGNTSRIVADYRDDFLSHSPRPGWSYQWNSAGPITSAANYSQLAWGVGTSRYSSKGSPTAPEPPTEGAYVSLTGSGGHPGRGTSQGQTTDRYAIAAYTAKLTGYYALSNGFVTSSSTASNGGRLIIYTETASGATFTQKFSATFAAGATLNISSFNVGQLQPGDTVYVCVGPNTADASDSFSLDFSVYCNELANPF